VPRFALCGHGIAGPPLQSAIDKIDQMQTRASAVEELTAIATLDHRHFGVVRAATSTP